MLTAICAGAPTWGWFMIDRRCIHLLRIRNHKTEELRAFLSLESRAGALATLRLNGALTLTTLNVIIEDWPDEDGCSSPQRHSGPRKPPV